MQNRYADLLGRYTVPEAARLASVHPHTLRSWIKRGFIPGAEKVGGRYFIWKEPFDAWRLKGERPEIAA